jgi:hypothetical protein
MSFIRLRRGRINRRVRPEIDAGVDRVRAEHLAIRCRIARHAHPPVHHPVGPRVDGELAHGGGERAERLDEGAGALARVAGGRQELVRPAPHDDLADDVARAQHDRV